MRQHPQMRSSPQKVRRIRGGRPTDDVQAVRLYVVRWVRADGRDVQHRYYRRRADANRFLLALLRVERHAALYVSDTTWREQNGPP